MTRGRFITFEGGEGTGKSTQASLLAESLRQRGLDVVITREPGGTSGAEAIRNLLLDRGYGDWHPRAEALLFAAARSDHVERLIQPALDAGKWVVCDRYIDSSRAYQGGGGGLSASEIMDLHRIGSHGLLPDLTLLIEVDPEAVRQRLGLRDAGVADRIGGKDAAYHAAVNAAFAALADAEPRRIVRVDGNGSAEATHFRVIAALATVLHAQ